MKISSYSFYLSGLALMLPSVSRAGSLKERFEQYPSPGTSMAQKGVGAIESASGVGLMVVGTQFKSRNQYQSFAKAYDDYQEAARAYERAGGKRVTPEEGGDVAVLLEEPTMSSLAKERLRKAQEAQAAETQPAKSKSAETQGAAAAAESKGPTAEGSASASSAAGSSEPKGAPSTAEPLGQAENVGRVKTAIYRLGEALEDKARHSEILSRVYSVGSKEGDPLTRAGVELDRARLRLKAAAEKIVAQEGASPKASFRPFRDALNANEPIVITRDSVNEAKNIGGKIGKGSLIGRIGGLILLADGIYRIYIVNDMRDPGLFPLGWIPIDATSAMFNKE